MSVCLTVSVRQSVCVCVCVCLSVDQCLSVCLSMCLSVCLSVCLCLDVQSTSVYMCVILLFIVRFYQQGEKVETRLPFCHFPKDVRCTSQSNENQSEAQRFVVSLFGKKSQAHRTRQNALPPPVPGSPSIPNTRRTPTTVSGSDPYLLPWTHDGLSLPITLSPVCSL